MYKKQVLDTLEAMYSEAKWTVPLNWRRNFRSLMIEKIENLNFKANPGYGLNSIASVNLDVIKKVGIEAILDMCERRLEAMENGELDKDPVRLFIKREGHSLEKAQLKRWRLIWSVGLIDQLLDAFFFDPSLRSEVINCEKIPSKPGWSWNYGGMQRLYNEMWVMPDEFCALDKRFWDFTLQEWQYNWDFEVRKRLCMSPDDENTRSFLKMMELRYKVLKTSRIVLSDGRMWDQNVWGITKSGSKITISINSRVQVLLKVLYCIQKFGYFDRLKHYIVAMGDDSLERCVGIDVKDYAEFIEKCGHYVKYSNKGKLMEMNFCSHKFGMVDGTIVPIPINEDKHQFNISYPEKNDHVGEMLFGYCMEYAFHPHFDVWHKQLATLRPDLWRSKEWFQSIITGYESKKKEDIPAGFEMMCKYGIENPMITVACVA